MAAVWAATSNEACNSAKLAGRGAGADIFASTDGFAGVGFSGAAACGADFTGALDAFAGSDFVAGGGVRVGSGGAADALGGADDDPEDAVDFGVYVGDGVTEAAGLSLTVNR